MKIAIVTNTVLALFLMPFCVLAQTELFVSLTGKDNHPGTEKLPFATLERAKKQARQIKGPVTIYLRAGTYYLSNPIVFTSQDSRKSNAPLVIRNYKNEAVVLSGAAMLPLKWTPYKNGIYKTKVAPGFIFDQLFVNGILKRMARYPNYDSSARYLGGTAADAISKDRVAKWKHPVGGFVHALHKHEWGGFHYIIKGVDSLGEVILEGGWQNNRPLGLHEKYRYVENIFEELNTPNEWFYDKKESILYYFPPPHLNLKTAKIETPQIAHLLEFKGSTTNPVTNISIEGISFTHTLRTFMQTKEKLLRSDWTIYRGGAVLFEGTKSCTISNCNFINLGGNAIFYSRYNRNCVASGNIINNIGASAICFVGDPGAVRSPRFGFEDTIPLSKIDRIPGPKTNNYPSDCVVKNNLMFHLGITEKQTAGVEISMSSNITVSHNTIYDVPRAGINISEGTWGGHIIEYNDVFNTVLETGDHGAFNSWGRDRFWYPNKKMLDSIVKNDFEMTMLDAIKPVIIRNNRFRCDHGWDIDLDDGSSNYIIYNNVCLNGGLKLREGVNRKVENNIIINNSFHPHVWFSNSNDIFRHNIVTTAYRPIQIDSWGKEVDYNLFPDSISLKKAQENGTDQHSLFDNPQFENASDGDYRVKKTSPALKIGFVNFSMDSFGVTSSRLKKLAKKVPIPKLKLVEKNKTEKIIEFRGATVKNLSTLGEQSATGMPYIDNVLVVDIEKGSEASKYFEPNDVILSVGNKTIHRIEDFIEAFNSFKGKKVKVLIFRNQKETELDVVFGK